MLNIHTYKGRPPGRLFFVIFWKVMRFLWPLCLKNCTVATLRDKFKVVAYGAPAAGSSIPKGLSSRAAVAVLEVSLPKKQLVRLLAKTRLRGIDFYT